MKITSVKISNYLGIEEKQFNPSNVNIFEGPKGSGKSSVLEAIEMAVAKNGRRTEVIRHGEDEAKLFLEMDNGLEIDRRLRSESADYLKLRQNEMGIKSTESELRQFIKGDIFRPLDFIDYDIKKQTDIILNMIRMDYVESDYLEWFGQYVLTGVNTSKHTLQVLKDIESNYYKTRQEINREIKTLEGHAREIEKTLPANYDGNAWIGVDMAKLWGDFNSAKEVNQNIARGREIKEDYDKKVESIQEAANSKIQAIDLKFKGMANDIQDIIDISSKRIERANEAINNSDSDLNTKLQQMQKDLESQIEILKLQHENEVASVKESFANHVQEQKQMITDCESKITIKQNELANLDQQKQSEIDVVNASIETEIEKEKVRLAKVANYLENHEPIDTLPLEQKAKEAEEMRSHINEWRRSQDIRENQIAAKQAKSDEYSTIIERARELPSILLKKHDLPIQGISVDHDGYIRVNDTLLDGLSDGEKLDVAINIAMQRMGQLKIMCIDGFEKLNKTEQKRIVELCETNDIQAFITITKDTENGQVNYKNKL